MPDMEGQRLAVATVYALARKALAEPGLEREALRRIVGMVERNFMGNNVQGGDRVKGR